MKNLVRSKQVSCSYSSLNAAGLFINNNQTLLNIRLPFLIQSLHFTHSCI